MSPQQRERWPEQRGPRGEPVSEGVALLSEPARGGEHGGRPGRRAAAAHGRRVKLRGAFVELGLARLVELVRAGRRARDQPAGGRRTARGRLDPGPGTRAHRGAYGRTGVGEMPSICSTPAVLAALRDAIGKALTRAPVRPEELIE